MRTVDALRMVIPALVLSICASSAAAQALQSAMIIDRVQCADDPAQTYALFLPSTYTPERRQARRVLRSITAGASGRSQDRQYLTMLEEYRLQGR